MYDELVEAFDQFYGDFTRAAAIVGVSDVTARRYWHEGFPKHGLRPISDVINERQREARARVEQATKVDAEKREFLAVATDRALVRENAIRARAEEAKTIASARRSVAAFIAGTTPDIVRAAASLAKRVRERIEAGEKISLKDSMEVLVKAARTVDVGVDALEKVMKAERLWLGEPTEVIGVQHAEELPLEDQEREFKATLRAIERARARMGGKVEVLDGGAGGGAGTNGKASAS